MSIKTDEIAGITKKLKESLQVDVAIVDKYGFILSSTIPDFKSNTVISPTLLNFVNQRAQVSEELGSEEIQSIVLSMKETHLVLSFGKKLNLVSKVPGSTDLGKFLPSINKFISLLDKEMVSSSQGSFVDFEIGKEVKDIEASLNKEGKARENKYKVFTDIIKQLNQMI
jgi:hypothetical protein